MRYTISSLLQLMCCAAQVVRIPETSNQTFGKLVEFGQDVGKTTVEAKVSEGCCQYIFTVVDVHNSNVAVEYSSKFYHHWCNPVVYIIFQTSRKFMGISVFGVKLWNLLHEIKH